MDQKLWEIPEKTKAVKKTRRKGDFPHGRGGFERTRRASWNVGRGLVRFCRSPAVVQPHC